MTPRPAPRLIVSCIGIALAGAVLTPTPGWSAPPDVVAISAPAGPGSVTARVATDFPRVVDYRTTDGTLSGQPEPIDTVTINGTDHRAELTRPARVSPTRVDYTLGFPDLEGVELDARISVAGPVLTFAITAVRDTAVYRVGTIAVPDHDLVSVRGDQPGAATAFTTLDPDSTRTADRFTDIAADTAPDDAPTGATYGFVSTDTVAAGIETNATVDEPTGAAVDDGTRLWHRTRRDADGVARAGVWSGEWTYRGDTAPYTEPLPSTSVILTGDANDDGAIDWQDGAVAFRSIMSNPKGAGQTPNRVVTRIPFNFASQATHPFLRTLDDTQRIALATDGLGQFALLKGYGSEGHDSAHPDYGGNYNLRAGGLDDLNTLLREGKALNTSFGVHVNATESYPEARAFSEDLVDPTAKGWNWLNQSYYIRQRPDLASGAIIDRFAQLRRETDPNLQALYIDVYYSSGWLADSLSRQLDDQGWQITTEWSDRFERSSLWAHWANDLDYGGATNKGLNSEIIRFLRNHQKDTWNADPVLGQAALVDFEGWTGEVDFAEFQDNIWTRNLPTKFLQQHEILDWDGDDIRFTDDVRGRVVDGRRVVTVGDATVIDGERYLLPWSSDADATGEGAGPVRPDKLYHWNPDGGTSTWQLPKPFSPGGAYTVYRLTDTGRERVASVRASRGRITLDAEPGQAYVIYPGTAPEPTDPRYGTGSGLSDPGFNAADLSAWSPQGTITTARRDNGASVARFGRGAGTLSQRVTGLTPGETYSASAWVEIQPGASRSVTLQVSGAARPVRATIERSTARNQVASDEKQQTYFQRVRVDFTARTSSATLSLRAAGGTARVDVDDVRVVRAAPATFDGTELSTDFEDVDQGWWPFVKGDAGGVTDPRTSLIRKHAPYTQRGWNDKRVDDVLGGEWSLKAHEENAGLVYRTTSASMPFRAGHRYRVGFSYASGRADQYEWVRGVDRIVDGTPTPVVVDRTPIGEELAPTTLSAEFVAGCGGDSWVGLQKLTGGGDQADFIIDDLTITDLGATDDPAICAGTGFAGNGLGGMAAGDTNPVTTSFTNHGADAVADVELALEVPSGWTVDATSPARFDTVAPGATVTTDWTVTVPADTDAGSYPVTSRAGYTDQGAPVEVSREGTALVVPDGVIPQSRMSVAEVSSEEPGTDGSAAAAIDGNPSTIWHTAWSSGTVATYPHHITLDLGATHAVDGLTYLPRQVGTNGRMKDFEIHVSTDGETWGEPVATGSFTDGIAATAVEFDAVEGRYVRLTGLSSQNGADFGGAAELTVMGRRV